MLGTCSSPRPPQTHFSPRSPEQVVNQWSRSGQERWEERKQNKVPITHPQGLHTGLTPDDSALLHRLGGVTTAALGGGGVVGCCLSLRNSLCTPRSACPGLSTPCKGQQTRGTKTSTPRCTLVYMPPAFTSVYLRNLKRSIFPSPLRAPTSFWLLVSAMTPPGSASLVCHFHLTKRGGPRAQSISPKRERRAGHPLLAPANPPHP